MTTMMAVHKIMIEVKPNLRFKSIICLRGLHFAPAANAINFFRLPIWCVCVSAFFSFVLF